MFKQLNELESHVIKDLEKNSTIPFNDLFENNEKKYRIVIPLNSDLISTSILNKINSKNLNIDFNKGIVSNGSREQRLGKFIGKDSIFTDQEKKWWNHQDKAVEALKAASAKNKYAIVVSRSPIDIARMSDHDGWTSCHDTDREYFHCALEEAKSGGPIAYIVNKEDLENIDLNDKDIFADKDRGVQGIKPISRLRLRRFSHKNDDYDLAVPEIRVYGNQNIPNFIETVQKWALESQQHKYKGRPKLKEFVLMGGSYEDNSASKIFNSFFQDDLDRGNVEYGGKGQHDLFNQYQEEVDLIDSEFTDLNFCHGHCEVIDADGAPYASYSGGIYATIPGELIKDLPTSYHNNIKSDIEKLCNNLNIYNIEDIEILDEENIEIRINLNPSEEGYGQPAGHPDHYREFMQDLQNNVEPKKEEFILGVQAILIEYGYFQPHYISNTLGYGDEELSWNEKRFQNFEWDVDSDYKNSHAISVWLITGDSQNEIKIGSLQGYNVGGFGFITDTSPGFDQFKKTIFNHINQLAIQHTMTVNRINRRQLRLFDDQPPDQKVPFSGKFEIKPFVTIKSKQSDIYFGLMFNFNLADPEDQIEDAVNFIDYMDKNFNMIINEIKKLFVNMVLPHYSKAVNSTNAIQPFGSQDVKPKAETFLQWIGNN